jgi:hypothetical protein
MLKAITLAPERASEAIEAAEQLVSISETQLELAREMLRELDLMGELPTKHLKQLVASQSAVRKIRAQFKHLAALA